MSITNERFFCLASFLTHIGSTFISTEQLVKTFIFNYLIANRVYFFTYIINFCCDIVIVL